MTAETERSIWPPFVAFYEECMIANAASAMNSMHRVGAVLKRIERSEAVDPLEDVEEGEVLNDLQNLVLQAAALSRYFWPVRKAHEWRGNHLRKRFNVSDASALKTRDLRNELEHFDERLDYYLEQGIVGHIIPQYIGPEPEAQEVPLHIFRAYYFDVGIFHLLGKRYKVVPIANEVYRVQQLLLNKRRPKQAHKDA